MNREEARTRAIAVVEAAGGPAGHDLDFDEAGVTAFHDFVIHDYQPPEDKRGLVFFQCSVRRPFYRSPSHGPMRRAIAVATGYDPWKHFDRCPVHVVVLASRVGPAPYELQDVYPVNVRSGGVKHFGDAYYEWVLPRLAQRMADYITAHRSSYDQITTFTEGRYGDVMELAGRLAGVRFRILPDELGPEVIRMGASIPRTYWQKYWIQLYLEVVSWLDPTAQEQAQARLEKLQVEYD